jgi:hypothetical protein
VNARRPALAGAANAIAAERYSPKTRIAAIVGNVTQHASAIVSDFNAAAMRLVG